VQKEGYYWEPEVGKGRGSQGGGAGGITTYVH